MNDWTKLIFLVYNNYTNYTKYFNNSKHNSKEFSDILISQINLIKNRMTNMENINTSFIENLNNAIDINNNSYNTFYLYYFIKQNLILLDSI